MGCRVLGFSLCSAQRGCREASSRPQLPYRTWPWHIQYPHTPSLLSPESCFQAGRVLLPGTHSVKLNLWPTWVRAAPDPCLCAALQESGGSPNKLRGGVPTCATAHQVLHSALSRSMSPHTSCHGPALALFLTDPVRHGLPDALQHQLHVSAHPPIQPDGAARQHRHTAPGPNAVQVSMTGDNTATGPDTGGPRAGHWHCAGWGQCVSGVCMCVFVCLHKSVHVCACVFVRMCVSMSVYM